MFNWEEKNYRISIKRRSKIENLFQYKVTSRSFKGTLPEVKKSAQNILSEQEGDGWKIVVETDWEVAYCCFN